jgi:outer membrane protein TolC
MNWTVRHSSRARAGFASLLACCALALPARATQPLEVFLAGSRTHSFEAREASALERQRAAEADVALARLIPSLSARGTYTRNQREVVAGLAGTQLTITPLNQLDALLQLDIPIVDLPSYHRYAAARSLAESAGAQRGVTEIDVSRGVARAYYQYLGASALVSSAGQSIDTANANQRNVESRRSAGAATDLDYERAVANVARAEQDLADATLGVALSGRALESLSGIAPEPVQGAPAADDQHLEAPAEVWMKRALSAPQLTASKHLREAAEHTRKAAARGIFPTLSASAQERITNATGFAGQNSTYALQLILNWRLDYSVRSAEGAQAAALEAQEVRLERTERAILDAVFEAHQRVVAGIAKSRAALAQMRAAERAAALSVDRYSIGAATQLDVTQAQRDHFLATAAKIQADSDLGYARASLRLAAGVPLTTEQP